MAPIVAGLKQRIANAWVGHLQKVANKHREEIRQIQVESGRTKRLLIRIDVFENDVKLRGIHRQQSYTYFIRVVDGGFVPERPADEWDGHVLTDIPVLVGLQAGYMDKRTDGNGGVERIQPFTPRRAWFMGRIQTEGDATMLANLLLMEQRLWGQLLTEIRGDRAKVS